MNLHCLCISNGFDPDEYDFLDNELNFDNAPVVDYKKYLIFFANLTVQEKDQIRNCFQIPTICTTVREYAAAAYLALVNLHGREIADILFIDLENKIILSSEQSIDSNIPALSIFDAKICLVESLETAWIESQKYCTILSILCNPNVDIDKKAEYITEVSHIDSSVYCHIQVPAISKKQNRITYCGVYAAPSIMIAIHLFYIFSVQDEIVISECKNCGKFFTPANRKDELYCSRCRKLSYDFKIKDDLRRIYRKIYKTQNARKLRNAKNIHDILDRFEKWKDEASILLATYDPTKTSLDELAQKLSSDDWIYT